MIAPRTRRCCRGTGRLREMLLALLATAVLAAPLASMAQNSKRMTEAEAEELFRSVDQMLEFIRVHVGLPVQGPVKTELTSRERIREMAEAAQREPASSDLFARHEAILKKKGFLPREFDLRGFLLELLPQDILGFYSPKTKTLYVADWLERGRREAVLMHEVVHAVQDQNLSLTRYLSGRPESSPPADPADEEAYTPEHDDGALARAAVIEGQAMAATVDYLHYGVKSRSLSGLYQAELQRAFEAAFPRLRRGALRRQAPLHLQASLSFPYQYGLAFIRELRERGGNRLLTRALNEPPRSTREVMQPREFVRGQVVDPMQVPRLGPVLGEDYRLIWVGTAGQFDVALLARQFAGEGTVNRIAPRWRGGIYYAARRVAAGSAEAGCGTAPAIGEETRPEGQEEQREKNKAKAEPIPTDELGLIHFTRWEDARAAQRFADLYARAIERKYDRAEVQTSDPAPPGVRHWQTEEGPVWLEQSGDTVLVLESFDGGTAERLRAALLAR